MGGTANNDNWAVQVQQSMETTNEILPASSSLVDISPSPFGLRICTLKNEYSLQGSPQRLFYVSKQAAMDRDPENHAMNGVGVRPGWYMIGEQGRFYVEVNEADIATSCENRVAVSLKVDGQDINDGRLFEKEGSILKKGSCSRFNGFMKSWFRAPDTLVSTSRIDLFSFKAISDVSEDKNYWPTDTGTISVHLRAGTVFKVGDLFGSGPKNYEYPKHEVVSEKEVAREGRALRAGCSGLMKTEKSLYTGCRLIAQRELVPERLTVNVRSRSWLRSRRIIDDDDQPFKHVDFIRAQNQYPDCAGRERVHVLCSIMNGTDRLGKKRKVVKDEMRLLDGGGQEGSVEVIDLS